MIVSSFRDALFRFYRVILMQEGETVFSIQMAELKVRLEFSGGAELLFGNNRSQDITLSNDRTWDVKDLLLWIKVDCNCDQSCT